MVWQFFLFPSFPSQLPRQITWGTSEHHYIMPTEVAGWLAESVGADNGQWVLILSRQCKLATGLVMRGPLCLNVVVGLTHLGTDAIETVKAMVPEVVAQVKLAARLHKVKWGGHPPYMIVLRRKPRGRETNRPRDYVTSLHFPSLHWFDGFLVKEDDPGSFIIGSIVRHLPLNVSGKLTKRQLKEQAKDQEEKSESEVPTASEGGSDEEEQRKAKKQETPQKKTPVKAKAESATSSSAARGKQRKAKAAAGSREPSAEAEESRPKKKAKSSLSKLKEAMD